MPPIAILFENPKLRLEMENQGQNTTIRPVGMIDEDVNFSVVLAMVQQYSLKALQFDMGHVTTMNSCGVREWLLFQERIPPHVRCTFMNVGELFVDQANMIPNMFGRRGTPVANFQAPFACTKCGTRIVLLLEPAQIKFEGGHPVVPAFACKTCNTVMEFDSIPDEYFSFIKRL